MVATCWDRIKPELDARGWGVQQLADALDVSYQAVAKVRDGGAFGVKNNLKAASLFSLNPAWLANGQGPKHISATASQVWDANVTDAPTPTIQRLYPVVSEVQAGAWTELCDNFQPGDATDWQPSAKDLGKCGYLLRVNGKSMENPGGRYNFWEGMLLHVNPHKDPLPNQFVVVRRESTKEATFKRFVMIDGEPYLEAINPDWPKEQKYLKLQPGDAWCGVVVDASFGNLP